MILYDNEGGMAAHPKRINRLNPERRNTTGLWANHDSGQRLAHQKSNIPDATTARFKLTESGEWTTSTDETTELTARMNRRCSGKNVANAKTNTNSNTEERSGIKKRNPNPNAASSVIFPSQVCAKETHRGNISMRGMIRNLASALAAGRRVSVWVITKVAFIDEAIPLFGSFLSVEDSLLFCLGLWPREPPHLNKIRPNRRIRRWSAVESRGELS